MAMNMRGSLNVSKFQKPGSNSPRFYGRCIIDGKTYNIKGWEKEGRDGPWISILFEPLEEKQEEEFEQCVPKKPGLFSNNITSEMPDEPF